MIYQVKPASKGKVRLSNQAHSVVLDEATPQEVLAEFFKCPIGKLHIDAVAPAPVSVPPAK
mgnify:CR=1 FL=1